MDPKKLGLKRNGYGVTDNWDEAQEEMTPEEFLNSQQVKQKLGRKDTGDRSAFKPKIKRDAVTPERIGEAAKQSQTRDQAQNVTGDGIKDDWEFLVDATDPVGTMLTGLQKAEAEGAGVAGPTVNSRNPAVNARNAARIWEQIKGAKPTNRAEVGIEYYKAKYPKLAKSGKFDGQYEQKFYDHDQLIDGEFNPQTNTSHVYNHYNQKRMPDYVAAAAHENQHATQMKRQGREAFGGKDYFDPSASDQFSRKIGLKNRDMKEALDDHAFEMYENQPVEREANQAAKTATKTHDRWLKALDEDQLEEVGQELTHERFDGRYSGGLQHLDSEDIGEFARPEMRGYHGTGEKKGTIEFKSGEYHDSFAKKLGHRNKDEAVEKGKFIAIRDTEIQIPQDTDLDSKGVRDALTAAIKDAERTGERMFHVIQGGRQKTYDIFDLRQALNNKTKLSKVKPMLDDEDSFAVGSGSY